jgi:hypothetical protein
MEWRCWKLLHAGEGPRGEDVTVFCAADPREAAEQAAEYFDDQEQRKQCGGNDMFDGDVQYIEVEGEGFKTTRHEVECEVKRVYTSVVR